MPLARTRVAVALVSAALLGLELALMRSLSVRWWQHVAYMVISVALLGFGASGTALALVGARLKGRKHAALYGAALAFALSIPLAPAAAHVLPVNVQFLAWDPGQAAWILVLELVLAVPFFAAALVVGIALTDRPERVGGHYAANLVASGVGSVATVGLMYVLSTGALFVVITAAALGAALVLTPSKRAVGVTVLASGAVAALVAFLPYRPTMSQYKMLPQVLATPGAETIARASGPLGRIDVVAGPAVRHAPGLSLQWHEPPPPHALLIIDGDASSAVYDPAAHEDWAFLDWTTAAAPYALIEDPEVLVLGAGGGSDIGLARYHSAEQVTALEIHPDVVGLMRGPLAGRGGEIYDAPGVRILEAEARGYLASTDARFDLVQFPPAQAFGASGAGLYATQESYLYTVEAVGTMIDRLTDRGILALTRWSRTPPRDGLRLFDTAVRALERRGLEPAAHLAMIRSWATITVLVSARPVTDARADALRAFAEARSFDLAYLPDMRPEEANRFHVLDRPYYYEATRALVGPGREPFLEDYLFRVRATTDDRPYFGHFLRLGAIDALREQLGRRARAYLEVGTLMLLAALVQAVILGAALIVLPLAVRARSLQGTGGKAVTLAYFLALGTGFMLLEMGFLQRFILYLADPVHAAAAVIAAFLAFGGAGSLASGRWRAGDRAVALRAATVVVALAAVYLMIMGPWLALTQAAPLAIRFVIATATIAPLAFAMGHMLPAGLRLARARSEALVPWAWAANGFASVVATVGATVLAMAIGFTRVALVAMACYAAAGLLSRVVGPESLRSKT